MNAKKNIVIGVIYRIPNTNMMDFNTTHASVLEQLSMENKLVYLMGDYNIDLFNSETHDLTNAFVDVMYYNEFLPLMLWTSPVLQTRTEYNAIEGLVHSWQRQPPWASPPNLT